MDQRNSRQKFLKVTLLLVICAFGMAQTKCGKKELIQTVSDATTSLTAGVEIADSAYKNGVLDADTERGILTGSESVRKVLNEVNEFAKKFPEGTQPDANSKQTVLDNINLAVTGLDNLIRDGVFIKDGTAQAKYLSHIRKAKALLTGITGIIQKIEAAKSPPPTQPVKS